MSEDRSSRFGWREGDIVITKRPPPRDREKDEDRPEKERQEDEDDGE